MMFVFGQHVLTVDSGVKIAVRFVYLREVSRAVCVDCLEGIAVVWVVFVV